MPAAVLVPNALPLTPNGSSYVRALPAPELASPAETFVAPRSLWEEVLGDLGGGAAAGAGGRSGSMKR